MSLGEPRTDVALALRVIGRRTAVQRIVEAAWPAAPGPETIWPFDLPCPELPDAVGSAATTSAELEAFRARLAQWKTKIANYKGYKLDLTRANLQGADLSAKRPDASDAVFSGAILTGARLEGANLRQTRAEGAYALVARMEGATLEDARFDGAYLAWARMEGIHAKEARMRGAVLNDSELNGAQLVKTRMEGAIFWGARMECAELIEARMEGASLLTTGMEEANLRNARLEGSSLMGTQIDGAYLRQARLDGADIWEVQFERVKGLEQAAISDAAFRSVDLSEVAFSPVQIASTFGDASVELPSEMNWPAHWPKWDLSVTDGNLFEAEWRKWRAAPAAYVPPPPPGGTPN